MKYCFVVNPVAGKGKTLEFLPRLEEFLRHSDLSYEIYLTQCQGDATRYGAEVASTGEDIRFFACGGDGTLFELVNGVYSFPNAEVGVFPLGTGNDFIRYFGTKDQFLSIEGQLEGEGMVLDLIRSGDKVAHNICSMGLDAEVASHVHSFKKIPILGKGFSYHLSLLYCLLNKVRNPFEIYVDGERVYQGDCVLALAANSRWYGGGYQGAPLACPDDGLLDVVFVEAISRFKIPGLLKRYYQGKHLDLDICHFHRGKKVEIISPNLSAVNMDGEITQDKRAVFEILEGGLRFIAPSTVSRRISNEKEQLAAKKYFS